MPEEPKTSDVNQNQQSGGENEIPPALAEILGVAETTPENVSPNDTNNNASNNASLPQESLAPSTEPLSQENPDSLEEPEVAKTDTEPKVEAVDTENKEEKEGLTEDLASFFDDTLDSSGSSEPSVPAEPSEKHEGGDNKPPKEYSSVHKKSFWGFVRFISFIVLLVLTLLAWVIGFYLGLPEGERTSEYALPGASSPCEFCFESKKLPTALTQNDLLPVTPTVTKEQVVSPTPTPSVELSPPSPTQAVSGNVTVTLLSQQCIEGGRRFDLGIVNNDDTSLTFESLSIEFNKDVALKSATWGLNDQKVVISYDNGKYTLTLEEGEFSLLAGETGVLKLYGTFDVPSFKMTVYLFGKHSATLNPISCESQQITTVVPPTGVVENTLYILPLLLLGIGIYIYLYGVPFKVDNS